jgi:hypothetical protein
MGRGELGLAMSVHDRPFPSLHSPLSIPDLPFRVPRAASSCRFPLTAPLPPRERFPRQRVFFAPGFRKAVKPLFRPARARRVSKERRGCAGRETSGLVFGGCLASCARRFASRVGALAFRSAPPDVTAPLIQSEPAAKNVSWLMRAFFGAGGGHPVISCPTRAKSADRTPRHN